MEVLIVLNLISFGNIVMQEVKVSKQPQIAKEDEL